MRIPPEAVTGSVTAAASWFTVDITVPYIGASVPVLIAAVIGTIAGIALGDPISPRSKLFGHAFAYTVLGVTATVLVSFLMSWSLTDGQSAALAVFSSAIMRWLWPAITENLKSWLANINPFKKR